MASIINYRFKSYKEYSTITFEGNSLPLWELRYEIITQRNMVSKDFDLKFYDSDTNEQILDDYSQIMRNSYVIVHRIPAWMSKTGSSVKDKNINTKKMAKDLPEDYICFRCGKKGHYIQHCPTNNDSNYDIVKIRRPSGIPLEFLEKVKETEGANSVLVSNEGFVKVKPQLQEWKRHGQSFKGLGEIPNRLRCSECQGLMNSPVRTNCGHSFCENCISVERKCTQCGNIVTSVAFDHKMASRISDFVTKGRK